MFSVSSNFDDELPGRLDGLEVDELYGACDGSPIGHGRPRALTVPVSWKQLERHVTRCRAAGIGFNLLMNPLCLGGKEESIHLERRLKKTFRRAVEMGVGAVTVAHPWLVSLAKQWPLRIRASVFVGISTIEQARFWESLGVDVLALDTHVVSRDFTALGRILRGLTSAAVELPVNIGCLLRCPLARTHAARLSHSSQPGAQPIDPCARWCLSEKRQDPVHLIRADFIRPEDLDRYRNSGVQHFKLVDRACSTDVLVERVTAYHSRRWDGDLLELIGPRGAPPRHRRLPFWDGLKNLGVKRGLAAVRSAPALMDVSMPWVVDNRLLEGMLLKNGCAATQCADCGHCARIAARAVRPKAGALLPSTPEPRALPWARAK